MGRRSQQTQPGGDDLAWTLQHFYKIFIILSKTSGFPYFFRKTIDVPFFLAKPSVFHSFKYSVHAVPNMLQTEALQAWGSMVMKLTIWRSDRI